MITVEPFDPRTASDGELRAFYEIDDALERELEPDDPSPPFDRAALDYVDPASWEKPLRWVARDGDAVVGRTLLDLQYRDTNLYIAAVDTGVVPSHRRQGIGLRLLQPAIDAAIADGRTVLEAWTTDATAGDAFAAALGMEARYLERRSRLVVADIDRSMLDDWVSRAKERASEYSLVFFETVCPEELREAYVAIVDVMNTAPREGLDMEDEHTTPEREREREARALKRGDVGWSLLARHEPTGAIAGYTEIEWTSYSDELAWQGGTAVDPAHRNNGLGRWLKAAMLQRLVEQRPSVKYVDTWNAGSNEPMLNINIALGFAVSKWYNARQIDAQALRAAVAARL